MSNEFVTADTHFGHGNIIKYCNRPFLGSDEKVELARIGKSSSAHWVGDQHWRMSREAIKLMDDTIIDEINSRVGENDILYHLGDFGMPGRHNYYRQCAEYRRRIRCRNVFLIWGNHDEEEIEPLFTKVYGLTKKRLNNSKYAVLCHYAMAIWEKSHRGNIQLYGHSHSTAEPWLDSVMPGRRSMDVGIDNIFRLTGSYRPITFNEAFELVGHKSGCVIDHHEG